MRPSKIVFDRCPWVSGRVSYLPGLILESVSLWCASVNLPVAFLAQNISAGVEMTCFLGDECGSIIWDVNSDDVFCPGRNGMWIISDLAAPRPPPPLPPSLPRILVPK